MSAAERMWLWSQPLVAALALLAGVAAWALQWSGDLTALPTLQSLITGSFVLPGLALSLTINHIVVMRRRPPLLTVGEKLVLILEYVLVLLILLISLSQDALFFGFLLWPLLIVTASVACYTMVRTTIRVRRTRELGPAGGPAADDGASGEDDTSTSETPIIEHEPVR
jgi:hypothetical protein